MSLEVSNVVVCMVITEQHHLDDLVMWVQLHEEQVNIGRQPRCGVERADQYHRAHIQQEVYTVTRQVAAWPPPHNHLCIEPLYITIGQHVTHPRGRPGTRLIN